MITNKEGGRRVLSLLIRKRIVSLMRSHWFLRKETMGEKGQGLSTLFLPILRVAGRPKERFYSLPTTQVINRVFVVGEYLDYIDLT